VKPVFRSVQRATLSERTAIESLLEDLEDLEREETAIFPLSPSPESKNQAAHAMAESGQEVAGSFNMPRQRTRRGLFPDSGEAQQPLVAAAGDKQHQQLLAAVGQTPTKLFDASASELS
jgi:hypothetical protein